MQNGSFSSLCFPILFFLFQSGLIHDSIIQIFKSYDKGGIIVDSMTKQSTLYILTCQVLSIIDETANHAKMEMSRNFFELSH